MLISRLLGILFVDRATSPVIKSQIPTPRIIARAIQGIYCSNVSTLKISSSCSPITASSAATPKMVANRIRTGL